MAAPDDSEGVMRLSAVSDEDNPFSFLAGARGQDANPFGFFFSFESTGIYNKEQQEPQACLPVPTPPIPAIEKEEPPLIPALPVSRQTDPTLRESTNAPIARLFSWFSSNRSLTVKQARKGYTSLLIDRTPGARQFFDSGDAGARRACKYYVTNFALATWQSIRHQVAAMSTMTGLTWVACNSWAYMTGFATQISLAGAGKVVFGVAGGLTAMGTVYAGWSILWPMLFQLGQAGGLQLLINAFKGSGGDSRRRVALESPLLPPSVRDWLRENASLVPESLYAASAEEVLKFILGNFTLYMLTGRNVEEGFVSAAAVKEFMLVKAYSFGLQQLASAVQGLQKIPDDYRALKRRLESLFEASRQSEDLASESIHTLLRQFQQTTDSAFTQYVRENPNATTVPISVFQQDAQRFQPQLNRVILAQAQAAVQRMDTVTGPAVISLPPAGAAGEQITTRLSNELELQTNWKTWMLVGGSTALGVLMAVAGSPAAAVQIASDSLGLAGVKLLESSTVQHAFRWSGSIISQSAKQVLYSFLAQQIGLQQYIDRMVNWLAANRVQQARALDVEIQSLSPTNPNRNRLVGLLMDRVVLKIRSHTDIDRMPRAELLQIWRERSELPKNDSDLVRVTDAQVRTEIKQLQLGANRVTYALLLAATIRLIGKAGGGLVVRAAMSKQADQYRDAALAFLANKASVAAAGIQDAGAGALRAVLEQASGVYDFAKLNSAGAHWPYAGTLAPSNAPTSDIHQQDAWRLAGEAAAKVDAFVGQQSQSLAQQMDVDAGVSVARPPTSAAFAVAGGIKTSVAPLFATPTVSVEQAFKLTQTPVIKLQQSSLLAEQFMRETTQAVIGKRAWELADYEFLPLGDWATISGAKYLSSSSTAQLDQLVNLANSIGQTADGMSRFAAVARAIDRQLNADVPIKDWFYLSHGIYVPTWRVFAPEQPLNYVNLPNTAAIFKGVEQGLRVNLRDQLILSLAESGMNPKAATQNLVKRAVAGELLPSLYNLVKSMTGGAIESIPPLSGRISLTTQDQIAAAGQAILEQLQRGEMPQSIAQPIGQERRRPPRCQHCRIEDAVGKRKIPGKGYLYFCSTACSIGHVE